MRQRLFINAGITVLILVMVCCGFVVADTDTVYGSAGPVGDVSFWITPNNPLPSAGDIITYTFSVASSVFIDHVPDIDLTLDPHITDITAIAPLTFCSISGQDVFFGIGLMGGGGGWPIPDLSVSGIINPTTPVGTKITSSGSADVVVNFYDPATKSWNDGDNDYGVPDSSTVTVSSSPPSTVNLQTTTGIPVTLSSSPGTTLSNVQAIANPSLCNCPANVSWPLGFISFDINNVPAGGSATVTITMPAGTIVNTYYKYGPTPDNATAHWYPFMYDGQTGAIINGNVITLYFTDGKRGDNDLSANNVILDAGGPGYTTASIPEFPSVILPATMVICFLGAVFGLRKNK